jgi:hypothetical protein
VQYISYSAAVVIFKAWSSLGYLIRSCGGLPRLIPPTKHSRLWHKRGRIVFKEIRAQCVHLDISSNAFSLSPSLVPTTLFSVHILRHSNSLEDGNGMPCADIMASSQGAITIPNYHTTPHSCKHCQRILIKPPLLRGEHGFRYRLPHTKTEARQAARDGCPLFKLFIRGYTIGSSARGARDLASGLRQRGDWKYPRAGAFSNQDRIIYFAESLSQRPFQIRFNEKDNVLFTCMGWSSLWFNVTARSGMCFDSL